MVQSVPHALDEHVPALAGPLPVAAAGGGEHRLTQLAGDADAAQALLLSRCGSLWAAVHQHSLHPAARPTTHSRGVHPICSCTPHPPALSAHAGSARAAPLRRWPPPAAWWACTCLPARRRPPGMRLRRSACWRAWKLRRSARRWVEQLDTGPGGERHTTEQGRVCGVWISWWLACCCCRCRHCRCRCRCCAAAEPACMAALPLPLLRHF